MTNSSQGRLVVSEMVLEDFKSYAGKQTIGPFHKSFSAIVGPNGSGKSNVIDALLFVFGYRAAKLRLKNLSQLIHNSANRPDATCARVTVHFEEILDTEDGGYSILPHTQIAISRTVQKKGSSSYHINGSPSSFTAVQELLSSKGLDLEHNRFLILQGEVESISQMKPKSDKSHDGLLEYLEDIIGTSDFIQDIETATEDVRQHEEVFEMATKRLRQSEEELKKLETKKEAAEAFLTNRINLAESEHQKLQVSLIRANSDLAELERRKNDLDAHLLNTRNDSNEVEVLKVKQQQVQHEFDSLRSIVNSLADEVGKYQSQLNELEKERAVLKEKKGNIKQKLSSLQEVVTGCDLEIRKSNELIQKHQKQLEKYTFKIEEKMALLEAAKEEEDNVMEELRNNAGDVINELALKRKLLHLKLERF
ncbi:hypothetical protein GEMRC1_001967 [Eukaryota sp. GEM-RC1]